MISRVTVLLPFVPEIDTTGTRRSASRIHAGGVVRASAIRSVQRVEQPLLGAGQLGGPRRRHVALGQGERGLGEDLRPLRAGHGNVTIQCPGSDERWTAQAAAALAVVGPQPADPGDDRGDRVRPVARRDRGAEPDEGVAPGIALAVPGPPPADGDLDLDHRLEPVDVRALEQAGLDQSHGPGRIATGRRRRLPP